MDAIVQKVHMLILPEPDIAKAIAFYQQLGLKLIFHIKDKWAEMQLGDIKIGLCPTSRAPEALYHTGIVLQVADLQAVYNNLKEQITFVSEPKEAVHGIMVSLQDPGNNVLDLYQPTPEKVVELAKKAAEQKDDEPGCGEQKSSGCCKKSGSC